MQIATLRWQIVLATLVVAEVLLAFGFRLVLPWESLIILELFLLFSGLISLLGSIISTGGFRESALYRNPPYYVPDRFPRPTAREETRDQILGAPLIPTGMKIAFALLGLAALLILISAL